MLGATLALGAIWQAPSTRDHAGTQSSAGRRRRAAGLMIPLARGHLTDGSLQLLAGSIAASKLQLNPLGRFFGELHFGDMTQVVLRGIEGLVFSAYTPMSQMAASRYSAGNKRLTIMMSACRKRPHNAVQNGHDGAL